MVEHLPEELQPMAEYSQSIESTDDTGRTLVLRDFVEVNTSNKKNYKLFQL